MPLAEQLVHQRYVHPGPLVLRTAPLKYPAPATDREIIKIDIANVIINT